MFFIEFKHLSALDGIPRFVQQVVQLSFQLAGLCRTTPLHPGGTRCPAWWPRSLVWFAV